MPSCYMKRLLSFIFSLLIISGTLFAEVPKQREIAQPVFTAQETKQIEKYLVGHLICVLELAEKKNMDYFGCRDFLEQCKISVAAAVLCSKTALPKAYQDFADAISANTIKYIQIADANTHNAA